MKYSIIHILIYNILKYSSGFGQKYCPILNIFLEQFATYYTVWTSSKYKLKPVKDRMTSKPMILPWNPKE